MGDVSTHAGITHFVSKQLKAEVTDTFVPSEHYTYLEFGNYLTDVSQFRDPPAHHGGRQMATIKGWWTAVTLGGWWGVILLPVTILPMTAVVFGFGLSDWARTIFGSNEPASGRHGALAEFFRRISLGLAHQAFTQAGRDAVAKAIADNQDLTVPDSIDTKAMSTAAVDTIHDQYFTQYWPHEHLDFPIVADAEHHRDVDWFKTSPRKLLKYLEAHIDSLAQQLAVLERDWVRARTGAADDRAEFMVRLGHQLHVVEDYWFHSNFVELYRWGQARQDNPTLDPTIAADRVALLDAALVKGGVTPSTVQRRLFWRRLRYPVFTGEELSDLSETSSVDGTAFVATGGFGATDVYHTLGKALESMEHGHLKRVTGPMAASGLALFEVMFREQTRREMVRGGDESKMAGKHADQLVAGEIHTKIENLRVAGHLCPRAAEEFRLAFDLDKKVEQEWSLFPGVGGMLINVVGMMQEEREASAKRRAELNSDPTSVHADATANGASVENVGTHSLLAKDTVDSDPFRKDALRLAKHASASVAKHLITRVEMGPDESQGIDWVPLLHFYLAFPEPGSVSWWSNVLGDPTGAAPQPAVSAVLPQPTVSMLGPTNGQAKLATLRGNADLSGLKAYYRGFED